MQQEYWFASTIFCASIGFFTTKDDNMQPSSDSIYSISLLNARARSLLENQLGLIWVRGEISNFTRPQSGHWYFTLKDNQAQVRCAMFRHANLKVNMPVQHGTTVLAQVRVSLYEPRGDYQLIVEKLQKEGEGDLQAAFEQRKKAFQEEGLFDVSRKKALPSVVHRVGLVTSATGAALQDMLTVLKRRDPLIRVVIYPTLVQGDQAAIAIAQAIARANIRQECDLLIVGRGGGSLEDLWCFNEEIVVRTMAASTLPIVSAVGHETDVTLSDFVADVRAPTPSAAAELISQEGQERHQRWQRGFLQLQQNIERYLSAYAQKQQTLTHRLHQQDPQKQLQWQRIHHQKSEKALFNAMKRYLERKSQQHDRSALALVQSSPLRIIEQAQQKTAQLSQALQQHFRHYQQTQRYQWQRQMDRLNMVSPLACLSRGYSVVRDAEQNIVREANALKENEVITIDFAQGQATAKILHASDTKRH